METAKLKKFAQAARTELRRQVETRLIQVLHASSAARRENPQAVAQLERQIQESSEEQVIEKVAYTWFNRFCALRFLDVNGFTNPRVLTPMEGQITPEILAEAKMGHLDEELVTGKTREKVLDLLAGKAPSSDPQGEAYRLLLVSACNHWYGQMPFLFEQIADYTELLMPEDLLSQGSIVTSLREVMSEDICQDVEVIGWLYQFYIAEKKDEVFAGLKKNIKISAENIPAATQLFTPHWIVRYLVENSLGRLWLLNRPQSKLAEKMDYYIAPEEPETDFLRISSPEEIRICDPACGSGHMLTYAFDLLYAIYEEEGYDPTEIPALILNHNLYGVEIDDRAGALAAFALEMKAAARLGRRRFLRMKAQPNICVLQNVSFTQEELHDVVAIMGRDLFTDELRETLMQFEQAKNFGSLIVPKLCDPAETARLVAKKDFGGDLLLKEVQERVLAVLRMAEFLSPKYHVVVANPPYMGSSGYNSELKKWSDKNGYKTTRSDMYAAFIQRSISIGMQGAQAALVTRQDWAFTKSYEYLRDFVLQNSDIELLALLGKGVFETLSGEVVQPVSFVLSKGRSADHEGLFCNATEFDSTDRKKRVADRANYSSVSEGVFEKIPLKAFIFWKSPGFLKMFTGREAVGVRVACREGIHTGNNEKYLRAWWEVSSDKFVLSASDYLSLDSSGTYVPYNKGGSTGKWYGGNESCIAFSKPYRDEMKNLSGHVRPSEGLYFKEGGTWADVATKGMGVRYYPEGYLFDGAGPVVVGDGVLSVIANMNSKPFYEACSAVMPNLHFKSGTINLMPLAKLGVEDAASVGEISASCVFITKSDWDAYETSWDFATFPLLVDDHQAVTLEATYAHLRTLWRGMTDEMQRLEEENNRIFIEAYGLQDELKPEVPLEEITLTCNPAYRYGMKGAEEDREARLHTDTMAEFLSYAVGCMFGRYSLDAPGLILANQGGTLEDYLARVPEPSFMPDEDNVIPVLDGEWFADDVTERFRQFLRVTFGEEHYEENLAFIEKALGKDVRKYFLKDFYADHVKRYKKRPIYWLFSSPKGTFNALVYLHRYRPDTVSVVLQYLRDFRKKLAARLDYLQQVAISTSASQGEKTRANKEAETIKKQLLELDDYERETLYPLATEQVQLDLDDGVKVNYLKLGAALKKIPGLEAKED